jgi:hypothetical protein
MKEEVLDQLVYNAFERISRDFNNHSLFKKILDNSFFLYEDQNKLSISTGYTTASGVHYVHITHAYTVDGLEESVYRRAIFAINEMFSGCLFGPNGGPNKILFTENTQSIFNIDCEFHRTGLFAIVTFTNKVSGDVIKKHYTFMTKDKYWTISSSDSLRAFKEMRGEAAKTVNKIKYTFFTPDEKGSNAIPKAEDDGTVSVPSSKHCGSLILNVEVDDSNSEELLVEVEKVALVNGSSQFVWHKFTYRIWITKAGKLMVNKKKYEDYWWGSDVYNLADFVQHPLNEHYHHLLTEGHPAYRTDNVWITKDKSIFAKVGGQWIGLNTSLSNHFEKMLPSEVYAEYLIYQNFSKSL